MCAYLTFVLTIAGQSFRQVGVALTQQSATAPQVIIFSEVEVHIEHAYIVKKTLAKGRGAMGHRAILNQCGLDHGIRLGLGQNMTFPPGLLVIHIHPATTYVNARIGFKKANLFLQSCRQRNIVCVDPRDEIRVNVLQTRIKCTCHAQIFRQAQHLDA